VKVAGKYQKLLINTIL